MLGNKSYSRAQRAVQRGPECSSPSQSRTSHTKARNVQCLRLCPLWSNQIQCFTSLVGVSALFCKPSRILHFLSKGNLENPFPLPFSLHTYTCENYKHIPVPLSPTALMLGSPMRKNLVSLLARAPGVPLPPGQRNWKSWKGTCTALPFPVWLVFGVVGIHCYCSMWHQ